MRELWVCHLGLLSHPDALVVQHDVREARRRGDVPDTLLLLEHHPVYTRGRRSDPAELPMGEDWYRTQGIDVQDVDRGGKVTYHGPGQLVGYPIVAVGNILGFVRTLEQAMVAALAEEGLSARGRSGEGRDFTGVWVEDRKIGSIGMHLAHGITTHGFAVNVSNDLQPFEWIVPCGFVDGVRMTSVTKELGRHTGVPCFSKRMAYALAGAMGARQRLIPRARLAREVAVTASARA